jgi:hypothetical protein
MKRDGRTLDHKTLEEIRMMAVQRVLEGERPSVDGCRQASGEVGIDSAEAVEARLRA